jgi:lipopolysaccharide transport system permease protein
MNATVRGTRGGWASDSPVMELSDRPEPFGGWLAGLLRSRGLLVALAQKEFRVRYKRASLGVLWSVGLPLFQSAVLVFVFSRVGRFGEELGYSYAGFVLAGLVPWLYLSSSVGASTTAIVDASDMTDKIFFPRAVLALVSPVANVVTLGISIAILLVAVPVVGAPLSLRFLLVVPATVLLCAFTAALGLVLSALYVYFRDVKFIVQAVLMAWLYVTPVVYPPDALGDAGPWLDFNPLSGIVGLFQRAAVDAPVPTARALVVSVLATLILSVVAVVAHRHHDRLFVDLL